MPRPGVVDVHGNQVHSSRQRAEETMWSIGGRHGSLWLLVGPEHMLRVFSSEAPQRASMPPPPEDGGELQPLSPSSPPVSTQRFISKNPVWKQTSAGGGATQARTWGKKKNKAIPLFLESIGVLLWPQTELLNTQPTKVVLLTGSAFSSELYLCKPEKRTWRWIPSSWQQTHLETPEKLPQWRSASGSPACIRGRANDGCVQLWWKDNRTTFQQFNV